MGTHKPHGVPSHPRTNSDENMQIQDEYRSNQRSPEEVFTDIVKF